MASGGAAAGPDDHCRDGLSEGTGASSYHGCSYDQLPYKMPLLAPGPRPEPDPIPPYTG